MNESKKDRNIERKQRMTDKIEVEKDVVKSAVSSFVVEKVSCVD